MKKPKYKAFIRDWCAGSGSEMRIRLEDNGPFLATRNERLHGRFVSTLRQSVADPVYQNTYSNIVGIRTAQMMYLSSRLGSQLLGQIRNKARTPVIVFPSTSSVDDRVLDTEYRSCAQVNDVHQRMIDLNRLYLSNDLELPFPTLGDQHSRERRTPEKTAEILRLVIERRGFEGEFFCAVNSDHVDWPICTNPIHNPLEAGPNMIGAMTRVPEYASAKLFSFYLYRDEYSFTMANLTYGPFPVIFKLYGYENPTEAHSAPKTV